MLLVWSCQSAKITAIDKYNKTVSGYDSVYYHQLTNDAVKQLLSESSAENDNYEETELRMSAPNSDGVQYATSYIKKKIIRNKSSGHHSTIESAYNQVASESIVTTLATTEKDETIIKDSISAPVILPGLGNTKLILLCVTILAILVIAIHIYIKRKMQ